jgi:hypothetical protein
MIDDDLHSIWAVLGPDKADAPLVVDADAVLALAVALESFESVGGWNAQVVEFGCGVQHAELSPGDLLDLRREPARALAGETPLGFRAGELLDHAKSPGRSFCQT